MAKTPPPLIPLFLPLLLLSLHPTFSLSRVPPNETFTYTNSGEFGIYINEYDADYRTTPLYTSPFQLCFFNNSPDAFYLGLRMATMRSESVRRWVWQANRARPVRDGATLSLLTDGDLVLADSDGRTAWSTGTANRGVVALRLLDNGNMVLVGRRGELVWQSFDHPTDTLMVGQSLRAGGPAELVSRKSTSDGSPGSYRLAMGPEGLAMYVDGVAAKPLTYGILAASERLDHVTFTSEAETEDKLAYELKLSTNSGSFVLARPRYDSRLSFLRLEPDGNLVVYTYYDPVEYRAWEKTFAFFDDDIGRASGCELPSKCGALGVCEDEMCVACPTAKGLAGWSKSCAPAAAGKCGGGKDYYYYKVVGVESFLSRYGEGEGRVKVGECRRRCSLDCKCLGFMFWEKESRCWLAPVVGTLRRVDDSSHVAYIKVSK